MLCAIFSLAVVVMAGPLAGASSARESLAPPALDTSASGAWSSGTSFTFNLTTTKPDVIIVWISTYKASTAVAAGVSSPNVTWQLRKASVVCSGTQETKMTEYYGIASTALSAQPITVTLSATPTAAAAQAIAFSGAKMTAPFDPGVFPTTATACSTTTKAPISGTWSTKNSDDAVIGMYDGYTSTTETIGAIAGTNATLGPVRAGTGSSMAIEYRTATAALTNQTAAFGTKTTFWGITTDALTAG